MEARKKSLVEGKVNKLLKQKLRKLDWIEADFKNILILKLSEFEFCINLKRNIRPFQHLITPFHCH